MPPCQIWHEMCIRSESVKRGAAVREVVYPKTDRACAVRRPYVRVGELVRSGDSEHRRSFSLAPFSFPRPFLSLDRVLRILSLGRRRRRLREFLALILSQSPTLPPPLKGPVRMTFLKFCFSPSLYRDFESVWGQVERMGRKASRQHSFIHSFIV